MASHVMGVNVGPLCANGVLGTPNGEGADKPNDIKEEGVENEKEEKH